MLFTGILETSSLSSPIPVMTTDQIISTVSTTVSQQFTRSTTVHHTSSVSSVKPTTTSATNVTQLRQGVMLDKLHSQVYIRM